jgi:hypothetical protein
MHAWGYGSIKPLLAVFRAENNMNNDLAERLGHRRNSDSENVEMRQAVGLQSKSIPIFPGRCPGLV